MGNLIGSAQGESIDIGLWDMITYLVKRYIVSKVENDEFLCQYLLNNNQPISMLQYSQRAIAFEPLPSRVKHSPEQDTTHRIRDAPPREYDTPYKYDTTPKYDTTYKYEASPKYEVSYDTSPRIVEYDSEDSSEDSEEYASDDIVNDNIENDERDKLSLYSAYEAVARR